MPSDSTPPSQDLNFPPVRELDLAALMMRSTTTPRVEEPQSSLDESTYELLSDSVLDISDDEAHTASIASTDGPTPDGASEFSDDDGDDNDDYSTSGGFAQDSMQSSHASLSGHPDMQPLAGGEDSTFTEVPAYMERSDSTAEVNLEEQLSPREPDVVQGCKIVKIHNKDNVPPVLSRYGKQVRLVARAALSSCPLPAVKSYTILYVGMPERWLEDVITSRIEAALSTSPKIDPTRCQVQLDSPITHVYRCNEIRTITEGKRPTHVLVILDNGQQLTFGPKLGSNTLIRPDLVVFCHPSTSYTDRQEFANASEVFGREAIPYIDLALVPSYGDGSIQDNTRALCLCVEGRNDPNADYELKEVLPLDHYNFSKLEPSQLSRHLALISPHLSKRPAPHGGQTTSKSWLKKTSRTIRDYVSQRFTFRTLLMVLASFTLLPALLQGAAYAPGLVRNYAIQRADSRPVITSSHIELCQSGVSTIVTSAATPSVSSVPTPGLNSLILTAPKAKISRHKDNKREGKPWTFEIETAASNNHQFILKPSNGLTTSGKKPQLQISMFQGPYAVPIRYNRTLSGEYIVELEQQYPFSNFSVSIASYSKPLLQQSFEVALGHNKSMLGMFLYQLGSHLVDTQSYLVEASSSAADHMCAGIADLEALARSYADGFRGPYETSTQLLKETRGVTWGRLRKVTAPIRTASPMIRARINALRLRCKIEIASGLSSKDMSQKQSWACSRVQEEISGV